MKTRLYIYTASVLALLTGSAHAIAPIIYDANATAAYVNDGSSTNKLSPGAVVLRRITVTGSAPTTIVSTPPAPPPRTSATHGLVGGASYTVQSAAPSAGSNINMLDEINPRNLAPLSPAR